MIIIIFLQRFDVEVIVIRLHYAESHYLLRYEVLMLCLWSIILLLVVADCITRLCLPHVVMFIIFIVIVAIIIIIIIVKKVLPLRCYSAVE